LGGDERLDGVCGRGERVMGAGHPKPVPAPEASVAPVHFEPL